MTRRCMGAMAFALGTALLLGAAERVTMTVSPMRSCAPSDVVVRVHLTPDVSNRGAVMAGV
jgi:hypothetical protein